jgi:transcriptional regulator with XRE-family HTH domain
MIAVCRSICWLANHPMTHRLKTYVRPLRRRFGLSQREVAFLIGAKAATTVGRIEGMERPPSVLRMFACAIIFDAMPADLFPGIFSEVCEGVRRRARELYDELQGDSSQTTRAKLDFLEHVLARLEKLSSSRI